MFPVAAVTPWSPSTTEAATMDAIVLAGTHLQRDKLVHGENKAFLDVGGEPLICRVVRSLSDAPSFDRIAVVGPPDRINATLDHLGDHVIPVEEGGELLDNGWRAFVALLARLMVEHGVGVETDQVITLVKLDEDFFE